MSTTIRPAPDWNNTIEIRTVTYDDWRMEAIALFGTDWMQWRFVCPVCGHVTSIQDWKDVGAPQGAIAYSCVGRWIEGSAQAFDGLSGSPCNYGGGGLFMLNPVEVTGLHNGSTERFFEFDTRKEVADEQV